jgi:outer membrane protein TolC
MKLSISILVFAGLNAFAQQPPPTAGEPLSLTLAGALDRARLYSQQVYAATFAARIAHEDTVQAKAALLPSATLFNQFIYTQPNGTPSGIFVSNDGPRVYNHQLVVHSDLYSPLKLADYRRSLAAEAVARARAEIAARGLAATVVGNYYSVLVAQRKLVNAQSSVQEAEQLVDLTTKQERGGEAAHADVVKAQIQLEQRRIDLENARAEQEKARIALGVLLFQDYGQPYTAADDLEAPVALPALPEVQALATRNNPDLRAAQASITQQGYEIRATRAELYPTLSFDYFYGLNANQFAVHNIEGQNQLGSAVQAQVTVPLWNWGATRSKIRQSEYRLQQARYDLSLAQRTLMGNLNSFYIEANTAALQVDALRRTVDLSAESLRLTRLRYQAGEATVLEVVDAQTTLVQARNALADGLMRYRAAIANLQTLTGAF